MTPSPIQRAVEKKCSWWKGHQWSKWEDLEGGDINRSEKKVGIWLVQKRSCVDCGKVEMNMINLYYS